MKRNAREFIRSTKTLLDHILATLTPDEQYDLLDALEGRSRNGWMPWSRLSNYEHPRCHHQ